MRTYHYSRTAFSFVGSLITKNREKERNENFFEDESKETLKRK